MICCTHGIRRHLSGGEWITPRRTTLTQLKKWRISVRKSRSSRKITSNRWRKCERRLPEWRKVRNVTIDCDYNCYNRVRAQIARMKKGKKCYNWFLHFFWWSQWMINDEVKLGSTHRGYITPSSFSCYFSYDGGMMQTIQMNQGDGRKKSTNDRLHQWRHWYSIASMNSDSMKLIFNDRWD